MESPFALEHHREEEDDPRWREAARARVAILISAACMVPVGAIMIITAILTADGTPDFPDSLTILAMSYPFAGGFCALLAMQLHRRRFYAMSLVISLGIQAGLFLLFWGGLLAWAFS